jgi:hypothetical protein
MEANYKPMFTGKEPGKELTPNQARSNTKRFNCNRKENEIKAHYFSESLIAKILNEPGVIGLRVYYASNERKDIEAFLVGVDKYGNNVYKGEFTENGMKDMPASSSGIYASNTPCPDMCPPKKDF